MRKIVVVLGMCLYASTLMAAGAADGARKTEVAFAKAFADRDQEKFFSFIASDSRWLSSKAVLNGRKEIRERWSHYFEDKTAPFSWAPDRVVANAAGNLALSTGPVHDTDGSLIGEYSSIWQRQRDGSWKIIFDGPGSFPAPCPPVTPAAAAPAP